MLDFLYYTLLLYLFGYAGICFVDALRRLIFKPNYIKTHFKFEKFTMSILMVVLNVFIIPFLYLDTPMWFYAFICFSVFGNIGASVESMFNSFDLASQDVAVLIKTQRACKRKNVSTVFGRRLVRLMVILDYHHTPFTKAEYQIELDRLGLCLPGAFTESALRQLIASCEERLLLSQEITENERKDCFSLNF